MVYQRNKKAKGDPPLRQQSKRGLQHPAGQWPGWTGLCAGRFRSAARLTGRTAGRPGANRPLRSCHPGGLLEDTSAPPVSVRSTARFGPASPVTGPVGPDARPGAPAPTELCADANRREYCATLRRSGLGPVCHPVWTGGSGPWPGPTGPCTGRSGLWSG